jgi:hypothetical protein
MQLSLRLIFYLRHSLGGYTVGTTTAFWVKIMEALAPQIMPLNTAEVPIVAYEHLFYLLLRGRSCYLPLNNRLRGSCRGKTPQYNESPITTQKFGYDWFPLAANSWGATHTVSYKGPTTLG